MNLVITQYGARYDVDTGDGCLHILNKKALKWNLMRVFGLTLYEYQQVLGMLNAEGKVVVERVAS